MEYVMRLRLAALLAASVSFVSPSLATAALITIDTDAQEVALGDGALGIGGPQGINGINTIAFAEFDANPAGTYSTLPSSNPAGATIETITLGEIPIFNYEGADYFRLGFAGNETGSDAGKFINVLDMSLSIIDGMVETLVWTATNDLRLDSKGISGPGQNDVDFVLLLPVTLFVGKGFTTSSQVLFAWAIDDADAGNDFWQFEGDPGTRFITNERLNPVPLPAPAFLLLGGLGLLGAMRLRRRPDA